MNISADRIKLCDAEAGKNLTITSIPVDNVVAGDLRPNTSNEPDADLVAKNLKAGTICKLYPMSRTL